MQCFDLSSNYRGVNSPASRPHDGKGAAAVDPEAPALARLVLGLIHPSTLGAADVCRLRFPVAAFILQPQAHPDRPRDRPLDVGATSGSSTRCQLLRSPSDDHPETDVWSEGHREMSVLPDMRLMLFAAQAPTPTLPLSELQAWNAKAGHPKAGHPQSGPI